MNFVGLITFSENKTFILLHNGAVSRSVCLGAKCDIY